MAWCLVKHRDNFSFTLHVVKFLKFIHMWLQGLQFISAVSHVSNVIVMFM
jgi:hypothetical protein